MNKKGQGTLEYAILIAVVVGALLMMQHYMSRGVQGKLRDSADNIGEQYSAGHMKSTYTTHQTGSLVTKETFGSTDADSGKFNSGVSKYEVTTPAEVDRTATGKDAETITKNLNQEDLFKK